MESNIVGYQNIGTAWKDAGGEDQYYGFPNVGATFSPIKGGDTFRLGDVKLKGLLAADGEYFYQLDPETASPTDDDVTYVDRWNAKVIIDGRHPEQVSDEEADEMVGWWNTDIDDPLDDVEYAIGSAFIGGELPGENEVVWECNGAVSKLPVNINISECAFPHFCNPIPRTVKLSEIVCAGINAADGEYFYQLNPEDAAPRDDDDYTDITYVDRWNAKVIIDGRHPEQVSDEEADEMVGWWNSAVDEELGDKDVVSGECWIGGELPGNEDVVVSFPGNGN